MGVLTVKHSGLMITTRSLAIARPVVLSTGPFVIQENCKISVSARTRRPTHSRLHMELVTMESWSGDSIPATVFFTPFNGATANSKILVHWGVATAKH